MDSQQLLKKGIIVAPLLYAAYMVVNCPCSSVPSCKLSRFYSVIALVVVLTALENACSR